MRSSQSGKTAVVVLVILVLGAAGLAYVFYEGEAAEAPKQAEAAAEADPNAPMTEEERAEYLRTHVRIEGLEIAPDTKPDSDEPVPGLLRVKGTVTNAGGRRLERIYLAVYPQDDTGEVIGSYVENITAKKPLDPKQSGDFSFVIPKKKEYAGTFDHAVR